MTNWSQKKLKMNAIHNSDSKTKCLEIKLSKEAKDYL